MLTEINGKVKLGEALKQLQERLDQTQDEEKSPYNKEGFIYFGNVQVSMFLYAL